MITVFTSCYNQGRYLRYAIRSVLNQTETDFEYLIYDDGSTDNTWDVIQSFNDPRIRSFRLEKQKNVATVINRSVQDSTGDYWVWCPSDDMLERDCLHDKKVFSKKYENAIFYSEWHVIDENGEYCSTVRLPVLNRKYLFKASFSGSPVPFTGIWIPTKILKEIPFPENLNYSEDYYWSVMAMIHGFEFMLVQIPLQYKRVHTNRTSSNYNTEIVNQLPRLRRELLEMARNKMFTPGSCYDEDNSHIIQALSEIDRN